MLCSVPDVNQIGWFRESEGRLGIFIIETNRGFHLNIETGTFTYSNIKSTV
jgi:hypothetical protein